MRCDDVLRSRSIVASSVRSFGADFATPCLRLHIRPVVNNLHLPHRPPPPSSSSTSTFLIVHLRFSHCPPRLRSGPSPSFPHHSDGESHRLRRPEATSPVSSYGSFLDIHGQLTPASCVRMMTRRQAGKTESRGTTSRSCSGSTPW